MVAHLLLAFTLSFIPLATAACYKTDGSLLDSPEFLPCGQVAGQDSMCCGSNHTTAGVAQDVCQENGLCQNWMSWADGTTSEVMWRGSCTDPTWESPYCLKDVCVSKSDKNGNAVLSQCDDGTWCCGATEKKTCCLVESNKFALPDIVAQVASSSAAAASSSAAAASAAAATASPTSTGRTGNSSPSNTALAAGETAAPTGPATSSSKSMSTASIVGISVGASAAFFIALILVCLWCIRSRKRNNGEYQKRASRKASYMISHPIPQLQKESDESSLEDQRSMQHSEYPLGPDYYGTRKPQYSAYELPTTDFPAELEGSRSSRVSSTIQKIGFSKFDLTVKPK